MKYYLGVDGGGTKTKFILCDAQGKLISQSIQPTCHYLQCGLEGVRKVMEDGLHACLVDSSLQETDIAAAFVACAGYRDIEKDCAAIEEAVNKAFFSISHLVGNDMENALAGSLGGHCGINVIAGTGSIGLGKNERNDMARSGGWHHIFGGDEGSAYWIACQLIQEFTKQSDGRTPKTCLYEVIKKEYQLVEDSDILDKCVVQWKFDRTKIASMAQTVYTLAMQQDPSALLIYQNAAKELAEIYIAIYEQLDFSSDQILCSYSGGVFKSKQFILAPLQQYISCKPRLQLVEPAVSPEAGSIILAMQQDQVPIENNIIQNLKMIF